MYDNLILHRLLRRLSILAFCAFIAMPMPLSAQDAAIPRLELRPHCEENTTCTTFEVRDPHSIQTPMLQAGDTMDLDLVLHNPDAVAIRRFRIWLAYDPMLFEGITADADPLFPAPTPGELGFFPDDGFVKISGTASTPVTDPIIALARITLKVREPLNTGSPLAFYDNPDTPEPETGVFFGEGDAEQNMLVTQPGYLFVRLLMEDTADTASSASMTTDTTASSASSSAAPMASDVFAMLQVQGLRVTTEGSTVYVAWDALPSPELIGYHLYYGTVSGQYIQRQGIEKGVTSVAVRALPTDVTYYFAIRGVNAQQQETDFSREVGVSVGNPRTSTAPFTANTLTTPTPGTNGSVAGDTGTSSTLAILLFLSAVIGTFAAFRRQLILHHSKVYS